MERYRHETVRHTGHIPAMIAILDTTLIKQNFPTEIFIPSHWHRSLEISLIEKAEVILQIGEKEIPVEDDFTCINSGVVHSLRCNRMEPNASCIVLLFSYEFLKQYCPEIDTIYFDLTLNKNHDSLKHLYARLRESYLKEEPYSYLDVTACLLEILGVLMREYRVEKDEIKFRSSKKQDEIKIVLTYLHEHYQEDISLSDMAKQYHMSKEHFSRQFHHYVGKTFRDYLASYRLYKAYEDIIHSEKSIQDIARYHGFVNVRSLIQQFTKTYHDTPMQYRKNYKQMRFNERNDDKESDHIN